MFLANESLLPSFQNKTIIIKHRNYYKYRNCCCCCCYCYKRKMEYKLIMKSVTATRARTEKLSLYEKDLFNS